MGDDGARVPNVRRRRPDHRPGRGQLSVVGRHAKGNHPPLGAAARILALQTIGPAIRTIHPRQLSPARGAAVPQNDAGRRPRRVLAVPHRRSATCVAPTDAAAGARWFL